jgi:parallel beta-helix repeat protein
MGSYMLYTNKKSNSHATNNEKNGRFPVAIALSAVVASLSVVPQLAQAACNTYYVATTGSDSNPGTISKPWLKVSKASSLKPCDTLYVRGGVYNQYGIWLGQKGTSSLPIKVLAYPGEKPVLDGQNKPGAWTSFFYVEGSYYKVSGFEVKNGGVGVQLYGPNNTVSNMIIHDVQQNGVTANGDNSIIENNIVYNTCLTHTATMWASGINVGRDPVNNLSENSIIKGNTVYNNWGEGISTWQSDSLIMDNNTVYDNAHENTYIDNATNVIFKNNLVYTTQKSLDLYGKKANLLSLADENNATDRLASSNNIIINNMFYNGNICAFSWTIVPGSGLVGALIANNTFVNARFSTGTINKASTIKNNIFYGNDGGVLAVIPSSAGLTFSNNLWSSTAPSNASGPGNIIADPNLALTGETGPGLLTKYFFNIGSISPAINKGAPVYQVTNDYLVTSSGQVLNIGAYISTTAIQYIPAM